MRLPFRGSRYEAESPHALRFPSVAGAFRVTAALGPRSWWLKRETQREKIRTVKVVAGGVGRGRDDKDGGSVSAAIVSLADARVRRRGFCVVRARAPLHGVAG